ncbi:Protein kinase-like domain protein [Akanthomyces lecanii RCEF 1005]|uniref:Protein kinase-like domain protein n=1 Tax=Akanthomyces lecanii RCEF 1005 TaxID=1081108 RepID=A0A167XKU2_CORDF|nr:Protein kinase-like domain protein [Akanthomyces lecanii RCEF 1005]
MDTREFESLRKRLKEEEQRRIQAEQQRDAAEQQRKDAEQRREDAEHQLERQTRTQRFPNSFTRGVPANAEQKFRPDYIREWSDFPQEQSEVWASLMDAAFVNKRHFSPEIALKDNGKELRQRSLSSELDLGYFERQTVETRVASVIRELHQNSRLRETFHLKGDVAFENHANTLTDQRTFVTDMSSMSLQPALPRRSGRLAAQSEATSSLPAASLQLSHRKPQQQKLARPRADQFCVYNKGASERIPAFIVEYKAPHKLSLAHIKAGLVNMDLDDIVRLQENETPEILCRRVVAAVITQAHSYMITGGIKYAYICTGEAFIFVKVKREEPETAYYFLSIPKDDVGESTGWMANPGGNNRLHLTAVGQVLAFTLRALQTTPREVGWIKWAEARLKRWEMIYDDILGEIEEEDIPASDFKPATRGRYHYLRMYPVRTRSGAILASAASCSPSRHVIPSDDDDHSDGGFDPNTPSRNPGERRAPDSSSSPPIAETSRVSSTRGTTRKYCTQRCLRGLQSQASLDPSCPNVRDHGVDRHQLNPATLIRRLSEQFSPRELHPDTQLGCKSLHIHGTRGALFKVSLLSHGYTCIGKGAPAEFVSELKHEESVYARLARIQGTHVPVVLGGLDVPLFSYDGIVQIVRFMLMSYVGAPVAGTIKKYPDRRDTLIRAAERSLRAVQKCGVLHSDLLPDNIMWSREDDRVMLIDFERATIPEQRTPLMPMSSNRKRKRVDEMAKSRNNSPAFEREARKLRISLS